MKNKSGFLLVCFLFLSLIFSFTAQAATPLTTAKSQAFLKDVREAEEVTGEWEETPAGFKFKTEDGKYLQNKWITFDGNIYYINKDKVRTTGWVIHNKKYYYLNKRGELVIGWVGKQFYTRADGQRVYGAQKIDGAHYYFDTKTGKKKTGWITIGKKKVYYEKTTGKRASQKWIKSGSNWKYVNKNGVMQKSRWIQIGTKKYYVNSSGNRVKGEQYINGKWYFFKKNGVYDPKKKLSTNVDPSKKMIALTFDDGPGPYTSSLLATLRANNARATFFMVGSSVGHYSSVVKQMRAQHCELGNHTYDHPDLTYRSDAEIRSQISRTDNAIKAACGQAATVVRLPYGSGHNSQRVLNAIGKPSIYWSVDTRDWETLSSSATYNSAMNSARNGAIILMHDIHASTVTAAKSIIPALKSRGYQMVTVTELAKYKGKKALRAGTTYYNFY